MKLARLFNRQAACIWPSSRVCYASASSHLSCSSRKLSGSLHRSKALLYGLDRTLNDEPYDTIDSRTDKRLRFPNALEDWYGVPLTLRERAMMGMMETIMSKADWQRKVFDDEICVKWRAEAVDEKFSRRMFEHVFSVTELRANARFSEEHGFFPILDGSAAAYAGDDYVDNDTKLALQRSASRLEDVPEEAKDWHPNSKGQVLDLVHPSLYPLVYGRTKAVVATEEAVNMANSPSWKCQTIPVPDKVAIRRKPEPWRSQTVPVPDDEDCDIPSYHFGRDKNSRIYSRKFQWLPCDVKVQQDGSVSIASYINNLHPEEHQELYQTIESIITKAVPMWDATLNSTGGLFYLQHREPRIAIKELVLDEEAMSAPRPRAENEDDLSEDEKDELDGDWYDKTYDIVPPEPGDYADRLRFKRQTEQTNLCRDFAVEGLQVIVKLANIHLTPENPHYDGGSWHIEGQLNEHICASALYYYDGYNITDSYLAFRESTNRDDYEELPYEHGSMGWIEEHFGMENHTPFLQDLGHVQTKEGRLLTFPNVLQHRVEPFGLKDPSKPGHRKLLALFLVDPYLRIPSTSIIPPQQREWRKKPALTGAMGGMLYGEDQQSDDDEAEPLMDLNEAKKLRLELMAERTAYADLEWRRMATTTNLCEH